MGITSRYPTLLLKILPADDAPESKTAHHAENRRSYVLNHAQSIAMTSRHRDSFVSNYAKSIAKTSRRLHFHEASTHTQKNGCGVAIMFSYRYLSESANQRAVTNRF